VFSNLFKSLKIQIRNFLVAIPIIDKSWADDFLRKISLGGYIILACVVTEDRKMKAIELARLSQNLKREKLKI